MAVGFCHIQTTLSLKSITMSARRTTTMPRPTAAAAAHEPTFDHDDAERVSVAPTTLTETSQTSICIPMALGTTIATEVHCGPIFAVPSVRPLTRCTLRPQNTSDAAARLKRRMDELKADQPSPVKKQMVTTASTPSPSKPSALPPTWPSHVPKPKALPAGSWRLKRDGPPSKTNGYIHPLFLSNNITFTNVDVREYLKGTLACQFVPKVPTGLVVDGRPLEVGGWFSSEWTDLSDPVFLGLLDNKQFDVVRTLIESEGTHDEVQNLFTYVTNPPNLATWTGAAAKTKYSVE